MQLIQTYILSSIVKYPVSTLIEQNQDVLFLFSGRQWACGIDIPHIDWIVSESTHKREVSSGTLVPVLRTVSQKINDYKKQKGN